MCGEQPNSVEAEIARLLAGPSLDSLSGEDRDKREEEARRAIELAYRHFSERKRRAARSRFPYLSSEELADAWVDALMGVMRKALRGEFDAEGSLSALLRIAFVCRCKDRIKRRVRRGHERMWEEVTDFAERNRVPPEAVDDVYRVLNEAIAELPPAQRTVWLAYRDLGFAATSFELAVYLTQRTGRTWTVTSVRRARQDGRKKLRKILHRRGYDAGC